MYIYICVRAYIAQAAAAATTAAPAKLLFKLDEAAPVKTGLLGETEELGTDPENDGMLLEDEAPAPGVDEADPSLPEEVGIAGAELASSERPERLVGEAPLTGGTEMGWPAAEHWETTTLETAVSSVSSGASCYHGCGI